MNDFPRKTPLIPCYFLAKIAFPTDPFPLNEKLSSEQNSPNKHTQNYTNNHLEISSHKKILQKDRLF